MHTLDQLIIDVAAAELAAVYSEIGASVGSIGSPDVHLSDSEIRSDEPITYLILSDPQGDLLAHALHHAEENTNVYVLVGSRNLAQAELSADAARSLSVWERVFVAGNGLPLRLHDFISEALTSVTSAAPTGTTSQPLLILTHLPKSHEELRLYATASAAASASAGVFASATAGADASRRFIPIFVAGGNTRFMNRNQNDVLAESFGEVHASLGKGKFRCLIGSNPREGIAYAVPQQHVDLASLFTRYQPEIMRMLRHDSDHDMRQRARDVARGFVHAASGKALTLYGVGGVFSGAKPDHGGELLATIAGAHLRYLQGRDEGDAFTVIDLGSGNGLVSAVFAHLFPRASIIAVDTDADAVVSSELTLAEFAHTANTGVLWDESARSLALDSADVVLLNPPFHEGLGVDATLVQDLLDAALAVLKAGGELYMVHNSHLRYRREIDKRFARSEELARNAKFTVLRAVKAEK
ncbi:MAG: methyltransferase [Actinomycetaceae bacterium]|nr:class I SAM-dependent methyltransferase [Arcanobacterium sp.]MDD7505586.1 methyltransferase [Actinomycetaceae bacterium]MDY6143795.1 methyltransferase [Arcanobacterium sp.]